MSHQSPVLKFKIIECSDVDAKWSRCLIINRQSIELRDLFPEFMAICVCSFRSLVAVNCDGCIRKSQHGVAFREFVIKTTFNGSWCTKSHYFEKNPKCCLKKHKPHPQWEETPPLQNSLLVVSIPRYVPRPPQLLMIDLFSFIWSIEDRATLSH